MNIRKKIDSFVCMEEDAVNGSLSLKRKIAIRKSSCEFKRG